MHSVYESGKGTRAGTKPKKKLYDSYNGSTLAVKFLNACGWGPWLLNLGYFEWWRSPFLLAGLFPFQKRLVKKSVELLDPKPNEIILDVACGHGWTTNYISQFRAKTTGVDLCSEHIDFARARFGINPNVKFHVADATKLDSIVKLSSLDKILCLEAAFHFGQVGRKLFLDSAYSILKPGGKLLIIDLTWGGTRQDQIEEIEEVDPNSEFRKTWQIESFEPFQGYLRKARGCGFIEKRILDWTKPALFIQSISSLIISLGQYSVSRKLLQIFRPAFSKISRDEWRLLLDEIQLHKKVLEKIRYVAYEFEKPMGELKSNRSISEKNEIQGIRP